MPELKADGIQVVIVGVDQEYHLYAASVVPSTTSVVTIDRFVKPSVLGLAGELEALGRAYSRAREGRGFARRRRWSGANPSSLSLAAPLSRVELCLVHPIQSTSSCKPIPSICRRKPSHKSREGFVLPAR